MKTGYNTYLTLIKISIHLAHYLKNLSYYNIGFEIWRRNTTEILAFVLGKDSETLKSFESIRFYGAIFRRKEISTPDIYIDGLNKAIAILEGLAKQLGAGEIAMDLEADIREFLDNTSFKAEDKRRINDELERFGFTRKNDSGCRNDWTEQSKSCLIVNLLNKLILLKINPKV